VEGAGAGNTASGFSRFKDDGAKSFFDCETRNGHSGTFATHLEAICNFSQGH
jgi:hypothetical protein